MQTSPELLATVTRSGRTESEHFGHLIVCDTSGQIVQSLGSPEHATYMRSAAKPFQAMTLLSQGTGATFGWTDEEVAIVCASHSAEDSHRALARSVLAKAGLTTAALQCGPHPPLGAEVAEQLARLGQRPTRIYSNCSGKHAGMLAGCVAAGWPIDTYREPGHPLQLANVQTLTRCATIDPEQLSVGVDGCGVPSFFLSLRGMATAFARLAHPRSLSPEDRSAAERVRRSMTAWPRLIAGSGRFDTLLGQFARDQVVVKSGAEGVICAGIPALGLGLAVKTTDGNARAHPAIVCRILSRLLPSLDWESFARTANRPLKNTLGETVGAIVSCGDGKGGWGG